MTAQINRNAAFVTKEGSLTQYGWAVLQGLWEATGGAVSVTSTISIPITPIVQRAILPGDIEPVPASPAAILRRAWAVMSVQSGSSAEATTDGTPRKIVAWNTDGIAKGMVVDNTTGNDITAVVGGVFEIEAALSFTGTASKRLDFEIYVSGNATGFAAGRMLDGAGALGSVSMVGDVRLVVGDTVEVYHSTPDGGSAMTMVEAQLTVNRIDD